MWRTGSPSKRTSSVMERSWAVARRLFLPLTVIAVLATAQVRGASAQPGGQKGGGTKAAGTQASAAAKAGAKPPVLPAIDPVEIKIRQEKEEAQAKEKAELASGEARIVRVKGTPASAAGKLMDEASAVNKICHDPKERERPGTDLPAFDAFKTNICPQLCNGQASKQLDFCAFKEAVPAYAAALSDRASVDSIVRHTSAKRQAVRPQTPATPQTATQTGTSKSTKGAETSMIGTGGPAIADFSMQVLQTSLTALAKLIEDRAKREGIAWFLQRVGADMCGEGDPDTARGSEATLRETLHAASCFDADKKEEAAQKRKEATENTSGRKALIQREIRTYWFPALCGLAGKSGELLSQYGGGGKLLDGLRSAVAADMKGWPGASAGLGLGAALWTDLALKPHDNLFFCQGDKSDRDECNAVTRVRRAGASFIGEVMAGGSTTAAFAALGGKLDAANGWALEMPGAVGPNGVAGKPVPEAKLFSAAFQVAACTASVPAFFEQNAASIENATDLDPVGQAQVLTIAAFAATPACWTITGKGMIKEECDVFDGTGATCPSTTALAARVSRSSLERLSTVARLARPFETGAGAVSAQWSKLKTAVKTYERAAKNAQETLSDKESGPKAPDLSKIAETKDPAAVLKAARELAEAQLELDRLGAIQKQLQAALGVAQAAFDLGSAGIGTIESALDHDLYPGLEALTKEKDPKQNGTRKLQASFAEARDTLDAVSRDVAVVSAIIGQDWGTLASSSLASARAHLKIACAGPGGSCLGGLDTLVRHVGFVVALVGEKDPDQLANTLDSLADPPGGWRSKSKPGSFTISLGSIPGFALGAELRQGQYGVARESYDRGFYFDSPALVMPVGFDITAGNSSCLSPIGVFFSVLDPAAFLQYDSNKDGHLPGPRVTTAIAPGAWLRIGIKDWPLSINPYVVWRPGLRAWEASVSGPAADALQFGVAASVDVTLWELYAKHGEN